MMNPTQISNRKLTMLRKLNRKKYRENEQLFLVEGARAVQQVIENATIIVNELFFDESRTFWNQTFWNEIISRFKVSTINPMDFAAISDTKNPQGVIALCQMPQEIDFEELAETKGIILASDCIQDPGNMGTMIRTAAWFGIKGILLGKGTVDLFHPKVVRSTAGATGAVPYQKADLKKILPQLENMDWNVVLLDTLGKSENIRKFTKTRRTIVVIGNEANGIDEKLFHADRASVHISSKTNKSYVESLNASVAVSIALYELCRS